MAARLPITKTPKVYVGGAFIRSRERARLSALQRKRERRISSPISRSARARICATRSRPRPKAGPGWAKRTPYNRGQILYRLGEMLEARSAEMAAGASGSPAARAKRTPSKEVTATIDRLIYYAGWADKYEQVLGNVNPVSSPHFNFTVTEPMGIVGMIADDARRCSGSSRSDRARDRERQLGRRARVAGRSRIPSIVLGEMLATSDLPGGVVNLLTGFRQRTRADLRDARHTFAAVSARRQRGRDASSSSSAPPRA